MCVCVCVCMCVVVVVLVVVPVLVVVHVVILYFIRALYCMSRVTKICCLFFIISEDYLN